MNVPLQLIQMICIAIPLSVSRIYWNIQFGFPFSSLRVCIYMPRPIQTFIQLSQDYLSILCIVLKEAWATRMHCRLYTDEWYLNPTFCKIAFIKDAKKRMFLYQVKLALAHSEPLCCHKIILKEHVLPACITCVVQTLTLKANFSTQSKRISLRNVLKIKLAFEDNDHSYFRYIWQNLLLWSLIKRITLCAAFVTLIDSNW